MFLCKNKEFLSILYYRLVKIFCQYAFAENPRYKHLNLKYHEVSLIILTGLYIITNFKFDLLRTDNRGGTGNKGFISVESNFNSSRLLLNNTSYVF